MRSMTESASSATTSRRRKVLPAPPHGARARRSAAGVLEVTVQIGARQAERRSQPEDDPGNYRDRQGEQHARAS